MYYATFEWLKLNYQSLVGLASLSDNKVTIATQQSYDVMHFTYPLFS